MPCHHPPLLSTSFIEFLFRNDTSDHLLIIFKALDRTEMVPAWFPGGFLDKRSGVKGQKGIDNGLSVGRTRGDEGRRGRGARPTRPTRPIGRPWTEMGAKESQPVGCLVNGRWTKSWKSRGSDGRDYVCRGRGWRTLNFGHRQGR